MTVQAQGNFISRWQARATATLAQQPKWAPPVVSPYPQLIQVVRADFYRTISPTHVTTWNYGDVRGINLIPLANTEIDIFYPPYFQHSNGTVDGFGDLGFSGKYRFLSRTEDKGNYVVSAFINATVPTGDHKNGAAHPTIAPNLGREGLREIRCYLLLRRHHSHGAGRHVWAARSPGTPTRNTTWPSRPGLR